MIALTGGMDAAFCHKGGSKARFTGHEAIACGWANARSFKHGLAGASGSLAMPLEILRMPNDALVSLLDRPSVLSKW